jgi:hypothetical protein
VSSGAYRRFEEQQWFSRTALLRNGSSYLPVETPLTSQHILTPLQETHTSKEHTYHYVTLIQLLSTLEAPEREWRIVLIFL